MNMLDLGGTPQLPGEKKSMEVRDLLNILWRRKWLILIPLMCAITIGGVLCRVLPKMYTSTATIFFKRPEYNVERTATEMIATYQSAFKDRARMLITDVAQQAKLQEVFEKQGLIDKTRPQSISGRVKSFLFGLDVSPGQSASITEQYEDARDNLTIEPREDRPAIAIEYSATDPITARNVCDEIAKMLEKAELGTGEQLSRQKDLYSSASSRATKALTDKSTEISNLKATAQQRRADPEEIRIMQARKDTLGESIRLLQSKIERDKGAASVLKLNWIPREKPKSPVPGAAPTPEETRDMLASEALKQIREWLDRNPDDPKATEVKEKTIPELRKRETIESQKIAKLLVELPRLQRERNDIKKLNEDLTKKITENRKNLEDVTKSLAELTDKGSDQGRTLERKRTDYEKEYTGLMDELMKNQAALTPILSDITEYKRLARLRGENIPEPEGSATGDEGPSLESLAKDDPVFKSILDRYFPKGLQGSPPEYIDAVKQFVTVETTIEKDTAQLNLLVKDENDQKDWIAEAIQNRSQLTKLEAEQKNLATAADTAQKNFDQAVQMENLWKRSHESGESADVKRYSADLPYVYSSPKFSIIMLLSIVGGIAIGASLTLLIEMTDHTIKRPTDLRKVVDRPILAAIPALDIGRFHTPDNLFFRTKRAVEADLESGILYDKNYVKDIRFRSIATEQIRKLRLNMQTPDGDRVRTILVTSALAGEGKSTVAANLAVAISQMIGEYVLLIDADLRRPDLQNFFGMPPKPGLTEYLEYDIDLKQLLVKTEFDKLTLLQAGRVPANSTELLSSDRMRHLVREVKSRYPDRYIIIDSPPMLSTSEPNVLASQVDGVILVVRAGMTPRELVEDVLESLDPDKVIGVVMNDVRSEAKRYYSPSYV
jgi:exopolysaccharide/PEP-CTERM locus tyrosine autokinase